jgi:PAS domain S-box-containing protein
LPLAKGDGPEQLTRALRLGEPGTLWLLPLTGGKEPVGQLFCRVGAGAGNAELFGEWSVLGEQLGRGLQNQETMRAQARSVGIFSGVLGIQHGLANRGAWTEIPEMVGRKARELCEADHATVFVLESDGATLKPLVSLGSHSNQVLDIRVRVGEGITGAVAASRRGEIIKHAESDPRAVTLPEIALEKEAVLAVPLLVSGRLIGVLTLHKLEGRVFRSTDLDKVEMLAPAAASALETSRLATEYEQERSRFAERFELLHDAVIFIEAEGRITLVNTAARRLLKTETDDPTGTRLLDHLQRPEFAQVKDVLQGIQKGKRTKVLEEVVIHGRNYVCSISGLSTEEDDGLRGDALVFQDVTHLKEAEAQLLQSSKMSAVGQLAAGVAHEFNNLIAGIYGYAQFMKEHSDPKVVQKGVDVILKSSERARELTASLLTFSRRRPGRREPVDLNQIVIDTLLLSHRQLERSRIKVVRELNEIPLTVADGGKIQQVFLDLILNAQQAMVNGGTLAVSSRLEENMIEVRVEDDGPGIKSEHLARVFEPFFTTKGALGGAKVPGTGLGLSTAYNIVRDHGGSLRVRSKPGEGACLIMELPVRTLHENPERDPRPRHPRSLDCTGRILIVDDDTTLRELMTEILRGLGHEVQQHADTSQAMQLMENWTADMLIIDRMAPGMDDLAAYQAFRKSHPNLPILFIMSRNSNTDLESEGDPWMFRLNKPFRNRDLVALVSRVLSLSLDNAS